MLDLIEVKPKINKKKIILIICVAIIIVLASIFGAIMLAKTNSEKEEITDQKYISRKNFKHIVNFPSKLPVVNQNVKDKIQGIYKSEEKRVFLTFDDGPSKTVTPLILDFLKQENIKATFFVLGTRVGYYPDIVKRAYDEGHFIGNHGYSHEYSRIYSSPIAVFDEYNQTETLIRNAIQNEEYASRLMRLPGGTAGGKYANIKRQAVELLDQNDICHVDWNALTGDSAGSNTKEEMLESVKSTIGDKNSVVILMHDAGNKILTYEILPELIQYLRESGYTFMNFYDLMKE